MRGLWHFLMHVTGADDVSGPWYGFWSGFAGDLSLFGAAWVLLRKHNCHYPWCWRVGRYQLLDTHYHYCKRHHPNP